MSASPERFGPSLRRLREARGRSLREAAAVVEISVPYLSDIERETKSPPSDEKVRTLAAWLGASPDQEAELLTKASLARRRVRLPQDPRAAALSQALMRRVESMSETELNELEAALRDRGLLRRASAPRGQTVRV